VEIGLHTFAKEASNWDSHGVLTEKSMRGGDPSLPVALD
jgi:hypothetical protein